LNIPCVSLKEFKGTEDVIDLLSAELAKRYKVIPLGLDKSQRSLYLAMANPIDVFAMDEVSTTTGCDVMAFLAGPLDIAQALERCYGRAKTSDPSLMNMLFNTNQYNADHVILESSAQEILQDSAAATRLDDTLEILLSRLQGLNTLPLNESEELLSVPASDDILELSESDFSGMKDFMDGPLIEDAAISSDHIAATHNPFGQRLTDIAYEDISEVNLLDSEDQHIEIDADDELFMFSPKSLGSAVKEPPPPPDDNYSGLLFLETMRTASQKEPLRRRDPSFDEFPTELSQASIRLLSQPEKSSLPPAVNIASTRDLSLTLIHLLLSRDMVNTAELLKTLAEVQQDNPSTEP